MNEEITMRELLELLVEESKRVSCCSSFSSGILHNVKINLPLQNFIFFKTISGTILALIKISAAKELVSPSEAATLLVTDRKTF